MAEAPPRFVCVDRWQEERLCLPHDVLVDELLRAVPECNPERLNHLHDFLVAYRDRGIHHLLRESFL